MNALIISDLQAPFQHQDSIPFLCATRDKYGIKNKDKIICIGDEADYSYLSFHGRNVNGYGETEEYLKTLDFVQSLADEFPRMIILDSNHGGLPKRQAQANRMPDFLIREQREILQAPASWNWVSEYRMGDILFTHNFESNAANAALNLGCNVVQGHYHSKFEIVYRGKFWGMTVGCLIDDRSYVFNYNKRTSKRPILGCGVIKNGNPILVPMKLDKHFRWTGKI